MKPRNRFFELPWWSFLIIALAMFVGLRHGVPALLLNNGGQFSSVLLEIMGRLSWYASAPWVLVAILLFYRQRRRQALLDRQKNIQSIRALGWREFEMLCGELFHRRGFKVSETGANGPDGGIDLVLKRGTETWLVQCKRWKTSKVGVRQIRELYGLVAAHGATGGIFVTCGRYTRDAKAFAQSKPLDLIDGHRLAEMVQAVRSKQPALLDPPASSHESMETATEEPASPPTCPQCGSTMVLRTARRGPNRGREFWGCSTFPKCRGMVNAKDH